MPSKWHFRSPNDTLSGIAYRLPGGRFDIIAGGRGDGDTAGLTTFAGFGVGLGDAISGVGESVGLCFGVGVFVGVFELALKLKLKLKFDA